MDEEILSLLGLSLEDSQALFEEQKILHEQIQRTRVASSIDQGSVNSNGYSCTNVGDVKGMGGERFDIYEAFVLIINELPEQASNASLATGISLESFPFKRILKLLLHANAEYSDMICEFIMENSILTLLLATLSALTHQEPKQMLPYFELSVFTELSFDDSKIAKNESRQEIRHSKKGVGYSNGLIAQQWDSRQSIERRADEEKYSMIIIEILATLFRNLGNIMNEVMYEMIKCSCLFNMIASNLRNESVMDILNRDHFYEALFELIQTICSVSRFQSTLADYEIDVLINAVKSSVKTYEAFVKKSLAQDTDESIERLLSTINFTLKRLAKNMKTRDLSPRSEEKQKASVEELYVAKLKPYQFDTCNLLPLFPSAVVGSSPKRSKRLAQEISMLSTSLPLNFSSSIFVRCDSERLDLMKALIIGPADTPYENGCFEFDITFPLDFPTSPPVFTLKTTGHGTVRFNPNLYNCGKVCISILNTWDGSPEERWNEAISSLYQVLVSIQSLILVAEPFYNEPGYENKPNYELSANYNMVIREGTLRWAILEMIRNPPACFKEVIEQHFHLKRHQIQDQCSKWLRERKNSTRISEYAGEVVNLLNSK